MLRIFLISIIFLSNLTKISAQTGYFIPSERFSSGLVNYLCQDKYGFIWVATDFGLNKFDGYRFTTYLHDPADSTSIKSNTSDVLFCDSKGNLWVGTSKGLDRFDYATETFIHYECEDTVTPRISSIHEWDDENLIVTTGGYGAYRLKGNLLNNIPRGLTVQSENSFYKSIMRDHKGRIWKYGYGDTFTMKDQKGVHVFNSTQGLIVGLAERNNDVLIFALHGIYVYHDDKLGLSDIDTGPMNSSAIIYNIFTDSNNTIYIGTRGEGLYRLPQNSNKLERIEVNSIGLNLNTARISAITEDAQGNIWLGCHSMGLFMLPATTTQFRSLDFESQGIQIGSTVTSVCEGDNGITWCTVQGNGVYGFDPSGHIVAHPSAPSPTECIYRDSQGNYWIGTDKSLYSYNPETGASTHHMDFACDKFNTMTDDGKGNLYISTFSQGFCIYNISDRSFRNFNSSQPASSLGKLDNNWVMSLLIDHQGRVWIATSSGVFCYYPQSGKFSHHLLDGILCFSLCETSQGVLLIGTEQGLYKMATGYKTELVGLSNMSVSYIIESANGKIWCSTSMGIWQYDISDSSFIGHVNENGLISKEYIYGVGMHKKDDNICFASNRGLTIFDPDEVTGSHSQLPNVQLTGFFIAGKAVSTLTESYGHHVVDGPSITSDHFRVSYLDNSISLDFSLLDYNNPKNIIFEYRINESEWRQNPEGQNSIQLSHLQPGNYNIDVRAISGEITSETKTISVEVLPPWYQSTTAYILYFIGLLGILGLIGWTWRKRTNQRLDEEKMKFLINATHDIRSPLTLIMGATNKLKALDNPAVETIDRNAKRLMLLVNQILDERRIDKNQMQLHCRETNLVEFISGICKLYQFNADQHNITFTFEHDKDHVMAWIDRINFDKVVSNLLSNAFKYTFDGGEVKVVLRDTDQDIEIQVIDDGIGFKEEEANRLFDRFYQSRLSSDLGMQGTGIGLNLSYSITQMHGGRIKASQRNDGQRGSCFTVTLPKGKSHLKPEQIVTDSPALEVISQGKEAKRSSKQFSLLIVDDDPEIANYIIDELGKYYKFTHSPNGKEALKTLLTNDFDLVVSDVMMPEMDGITLLKRIKENPQISQLPVILLTSKAEVEHKLEGLKSGADAYIAKPFNMEELHIQIDNLIAGILRLRGKFSGAVSQEERVENIEVKGNDDALMERLMRSVNANMSNPNYNVDTMASDVGISRAQLHRKMKEITGTTSGRFLRNLRMEQAARLLREGKVNVSQIGELVGYIDQSHFSTAFKSHFGMSPTEYVKDSSNNSDL